MIHFVCYNRSLEEHKLATHTENPSQLICEECGYSTPKRSTLLLHIRQKHRLEKHKQCPYCAYHAFGSDKILIHIDGKHPDEGEKKYFCDECKKSFIYEQSLKHHKRCVHSEYYRQRRLNEKTSE